MKVQLIIIGDEILSGRTQDINTKFLGEFLLKQGHKLTKVITIGDDPETMREAFLKATGEAQLVLTSGGVGPTLDDLTKKVSAETFGKKLIESKEAEQVVVDNYLRFGREWNKKNSYHIFPEDYEAIANPSGLAPGLLYFDPNKKFAIAHAPGVPREFRDMVKEKILPRVETVLGKNAQLIKQFCVRTHSVPEEVIFFKMCPDLWAQLEKFGKVSSLPHVVGCDIIVSYDAEKFPHAVIDLKNIFQATPLVPNIWHWGNESLPEIILKKVLEQKINIGFAESCTGGLTSSRITDLAGSSNIFKGSIIAYANEIKINQLGVSPKTLEKFGAVSVECALEMAIGAQKNLGVDLAISFTGIAGPDGGTVEKPVGTVCIGWCYKNISGSEKFEFKGDRLKLKERFSERGLLKILQLL
jgi:nicotinamide-nucleotide amidase